MKVIIKDFGDENVPTEIAEFQEPLRVEIEHNKSRYSIGVDNHGKLYISSIEKTQLVLRPRAANSVEVDSE